MCMVIIAAAIEGILLRHFKLVTVARHHVFEAKSMATMQKNETFCD